MLPKALDELARDIEAEREASIRLKKALNPDASGFIRAHQLELITRVLDHVCKSDSEAAEDVFRIALGSLRTLVPFLKKKTTSVTDTIAAVEKYTVNFALSSSFQDVKNPTFSYREAELSNSLQKIFSSRAEAQRKPNDNKKVARRRNTRRRHDKENEDPDQSLINTTAFDTKLIDQLFFSHAATTLGLHMLLPNGDSLDVVNTTVGALTIRLTRCCKNMCLSDLLALTERAVLPWLNYLRSFDDAKSQRTLAAYVKRVCCFLFDQCRTPKNDPAIVLHVRLFALQLENPKLNQFATDLLQCVKNFTSIKKQERHKQHILDTTHSVYENALRYVAKFDSSDQRWVSEDVSAWLDNVALIWAKQKPRKPIPNVFVVRLSAFRDQSSKKTLWECFKLQNDLFDMGVYELDAETVPQDSQGPSQTLWNNVTFVLKNSSFEDLLDFEMRKAFLSHSVELSADWRAAEADGLCCLRLMRTLEPLRRFIVAASPKLGLSQGAELVLRIYLSALFRGFSVLSWPVVNKNSTGASAIGDILLRLNKMVGGAIEASRDLFRSYAYQHLFGSMRDVSSVAAKILQHHGSSSPSASLNWSEWLYNVMTSVSTKVFLQLAEDQAEEESSQFSEALVLCADELLKYSSCTNSFSQGYWHLQKTLRDGLLSRRLWWEATYVSLRLFARVTSSETNGQTHTAVSEAGRIVAQDIVRLARNGCALTFFEDLDIPADKLLSAFVEYSWWARKHRDAFKTFSKYLETIDGIVLLRRAVFESCNMSGLLCPVRRTHSEWLSFIHSMSYQRAGMTGKIWKSVKSRTCSGHYALGLADSKPRDVSCTTCHSQFLENLRKACEAAIVGSFARVSKFLNTLESILTANKQFLRHLELAMISVEALQWISTVLAFNSFAVSAGRALNLAHQCTSLFSISSTCETIKICKLLDSLPRLDPNQSEEKGVNIVKRSRKNDTQCVTNPCNALRKAKHDLKHSLITLWKFRLGSNQEKAQPYSIAGLSVDVSYNASSTSGQHRLGLVLELLHYLFLLGTLQGDIENLSEARYYMELCFQISIACFPARNNSFRRIASISRVKCMTRMDSRITIQDSVMQQLPVEEEDMEDGRDIRSNFCTLQTVADAMLYVEMAWRAKSGVSSGKDDTNVDLITAVYERCGRILEGDRQSKLPHSDMNTERLRLILNHGITYLLKGDQKTAVTLIKPLSSDNNNLERGNIRASASYQMARLSICQAGGLRTCLAESPKQLSSSADPPSRRVSRRRSRRANFGNSHSAARKALSCAMQYLVPCTGNFPLYRTVWNLAAMLESDPEDMSWRLEKTVGLSFSARYRHNMSCKLVNPVESAHIESNCASIDDLERQLQEFNLDSMEEPDNHCDGKAIMSMMKHTKSILVGLHMDESRSSFVVWRRCALGFQLKRLWLPSSGPQSYDGILRRIELILSEMKQSPVDVMEGQEMSKHEKLSWWEDRYRLDEKMKLILTEIQEVWLRTAINLLIPSLVVDSEETEQTARRNLEDYTELGERACDASDDGVVLGQAILLVDTPSEKVPWESLPLLRNNEISVTRTPSTSFLGSMWKPDGHLDHRKVFYVVNPDGNLERSESRFREQMRGHADWSGIVGQTSTDAVAASYSGEEIYLYCGHGAGENFFSPSRLCMHSMAPIALLMGCSSCRSRDTDIGDFESNGPAIEFLVHGSPAVVGNLWDVSDGEIDRLTSSILSLWLGDDDDDVDVQTVSLADAVAQSRSKCRLPYLVGAACIVMGVPDIRIQRRARN